jgi:hypothetical protein
LTLIDVIDQLNDGELGRDAAPTSSPTETRCALTMPSNARRVV